MDTRTDNWPATAVRPVGLIIRQKDPNNLEMPFDQLGDFITPSELFYIRSHFPTPELNPDAYRLSIRGAVRNELRLSYADIRAMPSRTCVATHWNAPATAACSWCRRHQAHNGNSVRSAMPNGQVFRFPCCWKARDWPMTCATSFWKALIAACRRKSQGRRVRSLMLAVSRGRGRWSPMC